MAFSFQCNNLYLQITISYYYVTSQTNCTPGQAGGKGCSDTVDCCVNNMTSICINMEGGGGCSDTVDDCASDVTGCYVDESDVGCCLD